MKVFDSHRADYESYGLTCEIWETSLMSRFDRHLIEKVFLKVKCLIIKNVLFD